MEFRTIVYTLTQYNEVNGFKTRGFWSGVLRVSLYQAERWRSLDLKMLIRRA